MTLLEGIWGITGGGVEMCIKNAIPLKDYMHQYEKKMLEAFVFQLIALKAKFSFIYITLCGLLISYFN